MEASSEDESWGSVLAFLAFFPWATAAAAFVFFCFLFRYRAAALRRMERAGCVLTTFEALLFEAIGDATHAKFRDVSKLVREPRPTISLPPVL